MINLRARNRTVAPVEHLPTRRPFLVDRSTDALRNDLVRYFAWGYFSRREVTERLRALEPEPSRGRPAA